MARYPNARNWQGILTALVLASTPVAAHAQEVLQVWQAVDAETGRLTGITELQALKVMFPDSASVRRRLLNAYLEAERPADALGEAVELVRRGYVFSPAARETLLTLEPTPEQRSALALQERNSVPLETSLVQAIVPADVRLVESVWRDPRSGDLFVTSVVSRTLHVRRGERDWRAIPIDAPGSLSGLAHDPVSGLLWVGSGVFDQTPDPATAFRGLIAIDPVSGDEKRRVAAPAGGSPSDIAVGADGAVYASDPLSGAVYLARPGASELEMLVEAGTFRSPQGIVAFPGTSLIVVSDYAYGLALVDVSSGSVHRVASDPPALLDGIDGLWLEGDRIVGMQNGARPMRIVELGLSADRSRVTEVAVREMAHPAWTEPAGGTISGGALVYVATGQWDRFGDGGATASDKPPLPTQIRLLALSR